MKLSKTRYGIVRRLSAEEAFGYISDFATYLKYKDIEFVYVQLPVGTRINAYVNEEKYPFEKLELSDTFARIMDASEVGFINIDDY